MKLEISTFPCVELTKEQALKPLEEAAEVFAAYQVLNTSALTHKKIAKDDLLEECADLITATCNLVSSIGCEDFSYYIERVKRKNKSRGRY